MTRDSNIVQRAALAAAGGLGSFAAAFAIRTLAAHEGGLAAAGALWAVLLLCAFAGWGRAAARFLLPGRQVDWGLRAAWGLALMVALGGLANLAQVVSRPLIFLLVAGGVALELGLRPRRPPSSRASRRDRLREMVADPLRLALGAVVVVVVLVQLVGSLAGTIDTVYSNPAFDLHDDAQAYLVFPEKMLQTGSMGPEPFEARRMLSLGGQSFLQAMVRAALPLRCLHLLDLGLGVVLLWALLLGWGSSRSIEGRVLLFAILVMLAFPHLQMRGNTSALLTAVVLLLAWSRCLAEGLLPERRPAAAGVLIGLQAGALMALKSTLIPAAVALAVVSGLARIVAGGRRRGLWELLAAAATGGLVMLPWMISIKLSNDTFLYPVFGRGTYGGVFSNGFAAVEGSFAIPLTERAAAFAKLLLGFLPVWVLGLFAPESEDRRPVLALCAAAAATLAALAVMGDPGINRAMERYSFPLLMAATVALLMRCLEQRSPRALAGAAALVIGALVLLGDPQTARDSAAQSVAHLSAALSGPADEDARERAALAELQAALPPGAAVLATLAKPYLLDFERNPVRIMSLPGMSSLPPGLPVFGGPEELADYLHEVGIRYLAYGGLSETDALLHLDEEMIRQRYPHSKMRWVMLRGHQRYRELVLELRRTRKRLYDDGERVLLDLGARAATVMPETEPELMTGLEDGLWVTTGVVVDGLAWPQEGGVLALRSRGWRPRELVAAPMLRAGFAERELTLLQQGDGVLFFELPAGLATGKQLRLESEPWFPSDVGGDPAALPLGYDLRSVEASAEMAALTAPVACVRQELSAPVDPARVWWREGFFDDNNWSDGRGVLDRLRWALPKGHCELVVELSPADPEADDRQALELELVVNGVPLEYLGSSGRLHRFRLLEGVQEIERVEVLSRRFVPAETQTGSQDRRQLGVPVAALWTTAGGGAE